MESDESFMEWALKDAFNTSNTRKPTTSSEIKIMFRTRQENGMIFSAASFSKMEHFKLQVHYFKLQYYTEMVEWYFLYSIKWDMNDKS